MLVSSLTAGDAVPEPHSGGDAVPAPGLGVEAMLSDIRKSLATLAALPAVVAVQPSQAQAAVPAPPSYTVHALAGPNSQLTMQDPTAQALGAVAQLLANINTSATPPPPTAPWANDSLQNLVLELKRQVEALAAAHSIPPLQATVGDTDVTPAPGTLPLITTLVKEKGKAADTNNDSSKINKSVDGPGQDTLLSGPGKLAAHVDAEVKEKMWKGEFVDIFTLIKAKRREIETKDKEVKASPTSDKKPKVEENITN
ncbi:hypothetical protein NDU88_002830 [Pleurodeles waltl]|uniref:Uncharacterized protein n=1 Tax=Pleurodeles waltl TaxID=8319 RepID=A0AAV7W0F4_PLEWA|nr:hypothetical protein NDU88_002830 [Pleurodeles waltl]